MKKSRSQLIKIITLCLISMQAYAQSIGNSCLIMQTANHGYLLRKGSEYQLIPTNPSPWLVRFKHSQAQDLISSKNEITKNQLYDIMLQSLNNPKKHPFMAELISFNSINRASYYDVLINNLNYNKQKDKITYNLKSLLNNKISPLSKLNLKHVVLLVDGDGVCINCGDPW